LSSDKRMCRMMSSPARRAKNCRLSSLAWSPIMLAIIGGTCATVAVGTASGGWCWWADAAPAASVATAVAAVPTVASAAAAGVSDASEAAAAMALRITTSMKPCAAVEGGSTGDAPVAASGTGGGESDFCRLLLLLLLLPPALPPLPIANEPDA